MLNELSIIIPVFNQEKFIEDNILSVLKSSKNIKNLRYEIILVNDGSTDSTLKILKKFKKQIKVINQRNLGRAWARLNGLKKAKYKVSLLLDSRVLLCPDSLTYLCKNYPSANTFYSSPTHFPKNLKIIGRLLESFSMLMWPRYYKKSRKKIIVLTKNNFNSYPKGTGCLVVPTLKFINYLNDEINNVNISSEYFSDDTAVLKKIAEKEKFLIDRNFKAEYIPRQKFLDVLRHFLYRGRYFFHSFFGLKIKSHLFYRLLLFFTFISIYFMISNIIVLFILFFLVQLILFLFSILKKLPFDNIFALQIYGLLCLIFYSIGIILSLFKLSRKNLND